MSAPDPGFGLTASDVKRRHLLWKAILVGLVAGLLASAFRLSLVNAERFRIHTLDHLSTLPRIGLALAMAVIGGGIGVWLVRAFAPHASGSGIPHLKAVVLGHATLEWKRLIPVKFFAGVLGIGGGLALGREGPTIQMGGATGLMISDALRIQPGQGERKALISAGAGAGLAAAFNAPLSGMIFVLEELHGAFTPVVFIAAFLSSVTADIVARVLTGEMPVFSVHVAGPPALSNLPLAAALGALMGLVAVAFNRGLLFSLDVFERLKKAPPFLVGALAGLFVGAIGAYSPRIVGSGGLLVDQALAGELALKWLPLIFVTRFALTLVSYGSGTAGGIFAPVLVLGAVGGMAVGVLGHHVMPEWIPDAPLFAVLGMGAFLAGVVRAPLTGIVLMVELTGQYFIMLPLLTACLCAHGVAEALRDRPIYEALMERGQKKLGI